MSEQNDWTASWAVIELMGHRRLGGYVSEATIAGCSMLRVDVPGADGKTMATQFYGASSVYCLTPTTEELARAVARGAQPEPVTPYELRQLPQGRDDLGDPDQDNEDGEES
jgi:hypothetical protein